MTELDHLKQLWQEHTAVLESQHQVSEADIRTMLRNRTRTALDKINRSIVIELLILFCMGIGGGWFLWSQDQRLDPQEIRTLSWYAVLNIAFYALKYYLLNRTDITAGNLRHSLTSLRRTLGGYMTLYLVVLTLLVPLSSISGLITGFQMGLTEDGRTWADVSPKAWAILIGVGIAYTALSYLLVRWYLWAMYGVHYQEIKRCATELEEARLD
ncbi:MAG: hypothetical protein SF053_01325 [Bacteroidia bacterium]|nr:hypothetical protein [Bacteroidia bacterium]